MDKITCKDCSEVMLRSNYSQAMLMQCNISSTEDIRDYICQHFTSVPEQEVFPLVVGAVAGAQLAAAHHFIVERGRATHGPDTVLRVNDP